MKMKAKHLIYKLYEKDYELLGTGVYSAVFLSKKNENIVYKIGNTLEDPYLEYINSGVVNNIHFPKIYSINKSKKYNMYLAKLEKLSSFSDVYSGSVPIKVFTEFSKAVANGVTKFDTAWKAIGITESITELLEYINMLCDKNSNFKLDLHRGNVMYDINNRLIITDPIADSSFSRYSSGIEEWLEESIENM